MIKILSIEFENYRQYKNITIEFPQNCENNLHILKAKNGTGKTTFLNAILWCLYSQEFYLTDADKALSILNDSIISESNVGDKRIIEFATRVLNVDELNIDLISSINPFQDAYEIMSKSLDARVFKAIQTYIKAMRVNVTDDEAAEFWPKIQNFYATMGRKPSLDSLDDYERRLAEVLVYCQNLRRNNG